jgi:hypothetical protein
MRLSCDDQGFRGRRDSEVGAVLAVEFIVDNNSTDAATIAAIGVNLNHAVVSNASVQAALAVRGEVPTISYVAIIAYQVPADVDLAATLATNDVRCSG